MGHFYHPPGVTLGRVGQPLDGRKGVPPSILNNPPPPASNPIPNAFADFMASMSASWNPPPARPWFGYELPPSILNNPISQGGGWNSRDAVYQSLFNTYWQPGPPQPRQKGNTNPVLLPRVDKPPLFSTKLLMQEIVQAWQVTWGAPRPVPFPIARTIVPPPAGKRHHLWHIGPSGVRVDVRDVSEVDSDPPDQ